VLLSPSTSRTNKVNQLADRNLEEVLVRGGSIVTLDGNVLISTQVMEVAFRMLTFGFALSLDDVVVTGSTETSVFLSFKPSVK
jgi:hypothetical protein